MNGNSWTVPLTFYDNIHGGTTISHSTINFSNHIPLVAVRLLQSAFVRRLFPASPRSPLLAGRPDLPNHTTGQTSESLSVVCVRRMPHPGQFTGQVRRACHVTGAPRFSDFRAGVHKGVTVLEAGKGHEWAWGWHRNATIN